MSLLPAHFKYPFIPAWRLQTSVTTTLITGELIVRSIVTAQPIVDLDLLQSAAVAVVCGVMLAIPLALFRFTVDADGIRTFNTIGRWAKIPWHQIAEAKPTRYYFLPHLRLKVDGRTFSFWLPLIFTDMDGLRSSVIAAAGPENPLALALPVPARLAVRNAKD